MGGLFKPKIVQPPPVEVPPTPVVDQQQVDRQAADVMRRRRGRAATMLTEGQQFDTAGAVATKTALGG